MSSAIPIAAAPTELWRMSATELAAVIQRRQASVREVVEAHLRRIDAVNPVLKPRSGARRFRSSPPSTPPPSGSSGSSTTLAATPGPVATMDSFKTRHTLLRQ